MIPHALALRTLAFAALLAAGPATAGEPADFAARTLAVHNEERAALGVGPLAWDADLASDARRWAIYLARERRFEHDSGDLMEPQGENLFMGTSGHFSLETMLGRWVEEKALLDGPENWQAHFPAAGHYTQMVWRGTSRLGCAIADNGEDEYLVCRYTSPGNMIGQPAW